MIGIALGLFLAFAAEAAAPAPPDPCATPGACRTVETITIHPKDHAPVEIPVHQTFPWIPQENLMMFPGDAIVFRLSPPGADKRLIPELVVGGEAAKGHKLADGELRMSFEEDGQGGTRLVFENHTALTIRYSALMVTSDRKPHKTSVCPAMPNVPVYEAWPHPIVQLALFNFYEAGPQRVCE
jgi:hypothetical protein